MQTTQLEAMKFARLAAKQAARSHTNAARFFCCSAMARSHIGSRPISIPSSVTCELEDAALQSIKVTGPQGSSLVTLPSGIRARLLQSSSSPAHAGLSNQETIEVTCQDTGSSKSRSSWGLARTKLHNVVVGLTTGFSLPVRLVGVGYRATLEASPVTEDGMIAMSLASLSPEQQQRKQVDSQVLVLRLGYPRSVRLPVPSGMTCEVVTPTELVLKGSDKESLGGFAARIRRWRPPEPYNGKGVFVGSEKVRRKEVRKK